MFSVFTFALQVLAAIVYLALLVIFGPTGLMGVTDPLGWWVVLAVAVILLVLFSICIGVSWERFDEEDNWEDSLAVARFILIVLFVPVVLHQLTRLPLGPLSSAVGWVESYRFWIMAALLLAGIVYNEVQVIKHMKYRRRMEGEFAHKT